MSIDLSHQIVAWRDAGLSWGQIATRTGISRAACQQRYARAVGLTERQQRKHAEALVVTLQAQLTAYRRAYGALHSAARAVVEGAARDANYTDEVRVVSSDALRELARCVSSTTTEQGLTPLEDTREG